MSTASLPDIVFYAMQPWENEYPSPSLGLARALAVHTRVWYVSQPPTYRDVVMGTGKRSRPAGVYPEAGEQGSVVLVVELPPILPVNALPSKSKVYDFARAQADKALNKSLRAVMVQHRVGDFIWLNMFAPTQFVTVDLHRPPLTRIYYTIDAVDTNWYTKRHGPRYEAIQCAHSDMALGTSSQLGRLLRDYTLADGSAAIAPEQVHVLPNAMAADIYLDTNDLAEPTDLASIAHPRVGFVGNLDHARIDYAGLLAFAKTRPDVHLVFVGPWNHDDPAMHDAFEAQRNIYLLGRRDQRECPAYLHYYDICMIPFAINDQTAAIYPLKINEYLAIGKPILATPFSEDIQDFRQNITLAPLEEWPNLVESTLSEHSEQRRQASVRRAADNTWANRAVEFLDLVGYSQTSAASPENTRQI